MKSATIVLAIGLVTTLMPVHAQEKAMMSGMKSGLMQPANANGSGIVVDVPVVLKEARVAFRIDRVASSGDNTFVLQQIGVLSEKLKQMGTEAKIVAVFNGDGGFMLLNDMAYNQFKKTNTGNPYKMMIGNLISKGVEIEECGMTMMREGWVSAQLLPGTKVNSGANLRVIDLSQKNFTILGM